MTEIKYKSEVKGKHGIVARIVADSISPTGKRITTFEVEFHRWILAEINTHRLLSRNYQSSRAVPTERLLEQIINNPATPVFWGKNQAGMQAKEECNEKIVFPEDDYIDENGYLDDEEYELSGAATPRSRERVWEEAAKVFAMYSKMFGDAGYHKQITNRLLEPFMMIKGVITATELDNLFYLRRHPDAQPEFQELARCMWEALQASEAEVLYEGEWHTPYVDHFKRDVDGVMTYIDPNWGEGNVWVSAERAKQISAAACAQVSFRKLDLSEETVNRVYSRLVDTSQPHASCLEHQATPMNVTAGNEGDLLCHLFDVKGVTHMDKNCDMWSGNFKNWIQNRKLLPNESCTNYIGETK